MLRNLRKLFGVEPAPAEVEPPVQGGLRLPRAMHASPLITSVVIGQTLVITLVEHELTASTAPDIAHEIKEAYEHKHAVRHLILDLENIKFIDSAGLSSMVDLIKTVKKRHGRIGLASATQNVEVLFKLTRLELLFLIRRSVIEAIDAIEPKG